MTDWNTIITAITAGVVSIVTAVLGYRRGRADERSNGHRRQSAIRGSDERTRVAHAVAVANARAEGYREGYRAATAHTGQHRRDQMPPPPPPPPPPREDKI